MYNKILVPLDGSKIAEGVIPFVSEIILGAKESRKIEITLLQVVPSHKPVVTTTGAIIYTPYTPMELENIMKPVMGYLNKIGETLKRSPMVTINTLVKINDDPADEILKTSDELKIDLVTISTHGRSGLGRWALGSVADRIVRSGATPVFMVRPAQRTE